MAPRRLRRPRRIELRSSVSVSCVKEVSGLGARIAEPKPFGYGASAVFHRGDDFFHAVPELEIHAADTDRPGNSATVVEYHCRDSPNTGRVLLVVHRISL